jgi:amino acid transporter
MMIAGNGKQQAIEKANTDSIGLWVDLAEDKLGGWFIGDIYLFLIVVGSFACGLAFHNAASRYLYAIGRELPATKNSLGRTPPDTPHAARRLDGAERHHAPLHARVLLPHPRRR